MKLLHCANLHLDADVEWHLSEHSDRREERLDTFRRMISYGQKEEVHAILIVGGLFDTPMLEEKAIKEQVLFLIQQASDIDFLYLQGSSPTLAYGKDYLATLDEKPDNLKLFSSRTWTCYRYGDVTISAIEQQKDTPSNLWNELDLSPNDVNIVALYGAFSGDSGDSELPPNAPYDSTLSSTLSAPSFSLSDFTDKHINYLASGYAQDSHVTALDVRGVYAESGCLEGVTFQQCGKKGFLILDIFQKTIYHDFISLSQRTLHSLTLDVSTCATDMEVMFAIESTLAPLSDQDLVSFQLTGTLSEQAYVETRFLDNTFRPRFYKWQLENMTTIAIDYSQYDHDISLKGEFVRTVRASSYSEETKGKMIVKGLRALQGKEVFSG